MFKIKKKKAYDEYLGQAKLFKEKNINYSFSLLNTKSGDVHKNLSRLVENGLSEDAALAAMTTHPAKTLGIEGIAGTIEKNKLANLIVTTKPYFDKKQRSNMSLSKDQNMSTISKQRKKQAATLHPLKI